jgi:competence protein ComEC
MLALAACLVLGALAVEDLTRAESLRLLAACAAALALALAAAARAAQIALAAVAFGIGAAASSAAHLEYDAAPLQQRLSDPGQRTIVRLTAVATEDGRLEDGELALALDVEPAQGHVRIRVGGQGPFPEITAGTRLSLWARLHAPRGYRNPGVPDRAAEARRAGIHAFGFCKSVRLLALEGRTAASPWTERARRARRWARGVLERAVPRGPEREVVIAMTLGDQQGIDDETAEAFRAAGTYHVLALSGAQVALLAGVLIALGRRAGMGPAAQAAVIIPVIASTRRSSAARCRSCARP